MAGLEPLLVQELEALGATEIEEGRRVVQCKGDTRVLYRINLESRTALRVLQPIARFQARNEGELYKQLRQIPWTDHMHLKQTLAVDASVSGGVFRHSQYVGLKTKDAIVDTFRSRFHDRPNVNVHEPDFLVNVHVRYQDVTVSVDTSGDSLHKRGYRRVSGPAPLNEVLAAGMLMLSGWDGESFFYDPMCGSGTLPIEAALMAYHIPPQWYRQQPFGFMQRKHFDRKLWEDVRAKAFARIRKTGPEIMGADKDLRAIRASQENATAVKLERSIRFMRKDFLDTRAPRESGLLIFNPPYNERMSVGYIEEWYGAIGDHLKQAYSGYDAWIISSNMDALKRIGLKASNKHMLFNGALECKFQKYELYEGSKKEA